MAAAIPVLKPISQLQLQPGSVVTVADVSWDEFEAVLQELGHRRASRIAYSNRTLQIMAPLPEHEISRDVLSDLVKLLLRWSGQMYEPFGSTTFKREGVAGVEPDACFYIQNYRQMIGRRRLEPSDPPPDLAIETDVTSKTTLDAYQIIGVPELWIFDGKLTIYCLTAGRYEPVKTSPTFPNLDLPELVTATMARVWQVGTNQALEEFEAKIEISLPPSRANEAGTTAETA
ncbi:MAG: Uma2 family endonuclease [Elainella sp.]